MSATAVKTESQRPWTLTECRDDGGAGQKSTIGAEPYTVGRGTSTTLQVPSNSVSKNHAVIEVQDGRPVVRDLGSTNGTFVNGRPVSEAPLADGDILQFADTLYRVGRPPDGRIWRDRRRRFPALGDCADSV